VRVVVYNLVVVKSTNKKQTLLWRHGGTLTMSTLECRIAVSPTLAESQNCQDFHILMNGPDIADGGRHVLAQRPVGCNSITVGFLTF